MYLTLYEQGSILKLRKQGVVPARSVYGKNLFMLVTENFIKPS